MAFLIILSVFVGILLDLIIANEFRNIAEMKGHDGKKYFWWCFVFTAVGYLMVVALPDRKAEQQEQPQPVPTFKAPAPTPFSSAAPIESPVPPAVTPIIEEDQIICPECNTAQRSDRTCCWNCGATFVKE